MKCKEKCGRTLDARSVGEVCQACYMRAYRNGGVMPPRRAERPFKVQAYITEQLSKRLATYRRRMRLSESAAIGTALESFLQRRS